MVDKSVARLQYLNSFYNSFFYKGSKFGLLILIAIFLILLGIIGIGVSTYFWNEETYIEVHGRFGIVFDAGGSGTRMYIYEQKNDDEFVQVIKPEACEGKQASLFIHFKSKINLFCYFFAAKILQCIPDFPRFLYK